MPHRLSVVVSQGQSNHPVQRAVEEEIVVRLLDIRGIDVSVVSHLVDLTPDSFGMTGLSGITGDLVVCAWLYPRATHWILDRNGIRGRVGKTFIPVLGRDESEIDERATRIDGDAKPRELNRRDMPARSIYCLDLRTDDGVEPTLEEIKRIARELATETVAINGVVHNLAETTGNTSLSQDSFSTPDVPNSRGAGIGSKPQAADASPPRRWYPVIDYSRCTNCLECIDFCLFGVYGIDRLETILVEQPDQCRKGCPACSRICPENAIIFPQHKSAAIAGSPDVDHKMKLDLSSLFGAPDGQKAEEVAARERDEYLLAAGRAAVREDNAAPPQTSQKQPISESSDVPRDELDFLIDQLDAMDI